MGMILNVVLMKNRIKRMTITNIIVFFNKKRQATAVLIMELDFLVQHCHTTDSVKKNSCVKCCIHIRLSDNIIS